MELARRAYLLLAMLGIAALATGKPALAAKHMVGGAQGWDVSADLGTWASSTTFRVGDELVFKYAPGLHSVVELSEEAYKSCDVSGAADSLTDGSSTVKLDEPGRRYFACGTAGHCEEGMKVKIRTLRAKEAATGQDTPSSSTPSASSSPWSLMGASSHATFLAMAASSAVLAFVML